MTSHTPPARDTRIDVLRAVALITIFVNHVPGNPLEPLTSKNFGFSDAAEAFVLLSGISAGFAYGQKFQPGAMLVTTLKAWRRAGVLYLAQLGTTMATLGIFAFFALHHDAPKLLEEINIGPVVDDTARALLGLATFGHQLGYNNILSMYAAVLVMLPLFLLIGRRSLRLMMLASGAVWFFAGLSRIGPPAFPNEGTWFLNPLSWQFLFVVGLAATMHVKRGGRLPASPLLIGLAAAYVLLSLVWVQIPLWGLGASLRLPMIITGFDKTFLSAPRLLHVLSAAYLIAVLPRLSEMARLPSGNPLAVMGRQALPVFVAGTILSIAAQAWRLVHGTTVGTDLAIIGAGIALQFALAYYIEWYRRLVRGGKVARNLAEAPARAPAAIRPAPAVLTLETPSYRLREPA